MAPESQKRHNGARRCSSASEKEAASRRPNTLGRYCRANCSTYIYTLPLFHYALRECKRVTARIKPSVRPSVRPSVCLSVKRVNCDKTKEHSAKILTAQERTIILVLRQEKWLVGDDLFYLKFWAKLTLFEQKLRLSIDIRS